jgi:ankyrin repeat protein
VSFFRDWEAEGGAEVPALLAMAMATAPHSGPSASHSRVNCESRKLDQVPIAMRTGPAAQPPVAVAAKAFEKLGGASSQREVEREDEVDAKIHTAESDVNRKGRAQRTRRSQPGATNHSQHNSICERQEDLLRNKQSVNTASASSEEADIESDCGISSHSEEYSGMFSSDSGESEDECAHQRFGNESAQNSRKSSVTDRSLRRQHAQQLARSNAERVKAPEEDEGAVVIIKHKKGFVRRRPERGDQKLQGKLAIAEAEVEALRRQNEMLQTRKLQERSNGFRSGRLHEHDLISSPSGHELRRDIPPPLQLEHFIQDEVAITVPRLLCEGGFLWKIPFHQSGPPKRRWFQILPHGGLPIDRKGRFIPPSETVGRHSLQRHHSGVGELVTMRAAFPVTLVWLDPQRKLSKSPPREMALAYVQSVLGGHKTRAFWQQAAYRGQNALPEAHLCFSLVGDGRTLDLAAESPSEARHWREALMQLAAEEQGCASPRSSVNPMEHVGDGSRASQSTSARTSSTTSAVSSPYDIHDEMPSEIQWSQRALAEWRRRIFTASREGAAQAVTDLLEGGCPVDLMDPENGDTALMIGCRRGHPSVVRACLAAGAKNDPHPNFGQTALQVAASCDQVECARIILDAAAESGADVKIVSHADENGDTPLHAAARGGNAALVDLLIIHGASLGVEDGQGSTPLHIVAHYGHVNALASLLETCGGDEAMELRDTTGSRPLHLAAAGGHADVVRLLLETAAVPDATNNDGRTPYDLAVEHCQMGIAHLIQEYLPGSEKKSRQVTPLAPAGLQMSTDVLPRPSASLSPRPSPAVHGMADIHSGGNAADKQRGNLFDGLDVYILGDRQPLGSPAAATTIATAAWSPSPPPSARDQARMMHFGTGVVPVTPASSYQALDTSRSFFPAGLSSTSTTPMRQAWEETRIDSSCCSTERDQEKSFDAQGPDQLPVARWYIGHTDGYPYYVYEPTGHSQWQDPRVDPSLYDEKGFLIGCKKKTIQQLQVTGKEQQHCRKQTVVFLG